jgi:hypothetical protein
MMDEMDLAAEGEPKGQAVAVEVKSKYEFVMAAAKEAERLNDQLRRRGLFSPRDKVTIEAVRRIRKGSSRVVYEDQPSASEDTGKESTYFFGS